MEQNLNDIYDLIEHAIDNAFGGQLNLKFYDYLKENKIKKNEIDSFNDSYTFLGGMLRTFIEVTHEANARYKAGKADMNAMAKASEMKVGDMKDTLSGFKFLTPEETKKSMESGNLDAFLKGMGTPGGSVDTSFLPL